MNTIALSLSELFQLAALGPCFFVALYLLSSFRNLNRTLVPALYFTVLGGGFLLQIIDGALDIQNNPVLRGTLITLENILPELSFLLILQFVLGVRPPWAYWLVFAIPLIGGSPFIYLALTQTQVCFGDENCHAPAFFIDLYRVFGAALVFMLLVVLLGRQRLTIAVEDSTRISKIWLIRVLILSNVLLLLVDLLQLSGRLKPEETNFIRTMISVTFVYLVLSSLFRVFAENFGFKSPSLTPPRIFTLKDQDIVERMELIIEKEKPYTKLGFNRKKMAEKLGIKEHQLSKAINMKYQKSFSECMNDYRIRDAQKLLTETTIPITVISYDTGFSSIASFNRVFKSITNRSPREYRQQQKKKT